MDLPALLREQRLLAIVRGRHAESVLETVLVLAREGVSLIEVSLTSASALDVISRARAELGTEAVIGAGTVVTTQDARDAHAAGAEYVVTPGIGDGVRQARDLGLPTVVGALAVGVGSPLIGDAADGGDPEALRVRIRGFLGAALDTTAGIAQ